MTNQDSQLVIAKSYKNLKKPKRTVFSITKEVISKMEHVSKESKRRLTESLK